MTKSSGANSIAPSRNKSTGPTWKLLSSDNLKSATVHLKHSHSHTMTHSHTHTLTHSGEESVTQVDCRQITFSPAHKHHLLIIYPREVVVMDMEIRQAIGSLSLERNTSPLLRLMPCRHRNALFCLHENGSVSLRFHQNTPLPPSLPTTSSLEPRVQVPLYLLLPLPPPPFISPSHLPRYPVSPTLSAAPQSHSESANSAQCSLVPSASQLRRELPS